VSASLDWIKCCITYALVHVLMCRDFPVRGKFVLLARAPAACCSHLFLPSPLNSQPALYPGCGICVKKCPFEAISIINLPKDLERNTTHRYGPNSFKLHRLPMPRPGQVLGLVGTNGIGKSTALKILAGKMKPNLGKYDSPPDWEEILVHFRGSDLQNYFTKILEDTMKATIKPQYVDHIPRAVRGLVGDILKQKDEVRALSIQFWQLQILARMTYFACFLILMPSLCQRSTRLDSFPELKSCR
jgi:ferredoxin